MSKRRNAATKDNFNMYIITFVFCTLVFTFIHYKVSCYPHDSDLNLFTSSLLNNNSDVTTIDNSINVLIDKNNDYDNNENARESPNTSQDKHKSYQQFFDDYGSSFSVNDSSSDSVECILARSEFYLSWWVFDNGSLRLPSFNRLNTSGILDLSLQFSSEDQILTHILSFTSDNPSDVNY